MLTQHLDRLLGARSIRRCSIASATVWPGTGSEVGQPRAIPSTCWRGQCAAVTVAGVSSGNWRPDAPRGRTGVPGAPGSPTRSVRAIRRMRSSWIDWSLRSFSGWPPTSQCGCRRGNVSVWPWPRGRMRTAVSTRDYRLGWKGCGARTVSGRMRGRRDAVWKMSSRRTFKRTERTRRKWKPGCRNSKRTRREGSA